MALNKIAENKQTNLKWRTVVDAAVDLVNTHDTALTNLQIQVNNIQDVYNQVISNDADILAIQGRLNIIEAANWVTSSRIANGTIIAADIGDLQITTAKLAESGVTTTKIANSNVTLGKVNFVLDNDTLQDRDDVVPTHGNVRNYIQSYVGSSGASHNIASAFHTDLAIDSQNSANWAPGQSLIWNGSEFINSYAGPAGATDSIFVGVTGVTGVTATGDLDTGGSNPIGSTDLSYESSIGGNGVVVDGTATYTLANFTGTGLQVENVRGVYIKYVVNIGATSGDQKAELYVTYPDGSTQPLMVSNRNYTYKQTDAETHLEGIALIPLNPDQVDFTITVDVDDLGTDHERVYFEIIGFNQIGISALSPEVDVEHLRGGVDAYSTSAHNGYISSGSTITAQTWYSGVPASVYSTGTLGSNSVLPLDVPEGTTKSVITGNTQWRGAATNDNEDMASFTITVDWVNGTVLGAWEYNVGNGDAYSNGGHWNGVIDADVAATYGEAGSYDSATFALAPPTFGTSGGTITKLPIFNDLTFFRYDITHYKTAGSNVIQDLADASHNSVPTSQAVVDFMASSTSAAEDGYMTFGNIIIQWGKHESPIGDIPGGTFDYVVTFPTAFSDTAYSMTITPKGSVYSIATSVAALTATQGTARFQEAGGVQAFDGFYWMAIGPA